MVAGESGVPMDSSNRSTNSSINLKSSLLGDAHILKSVLRKVARNVTKDNNTTSGATLDKQGTNSSLSCEADLHNLNVAHGIPPSGTSELNINDKTSGNVTFNKNSYDKNSNDESNLRRTLLNLLPMLVIMVCVLILKMIAKRIYQIRVPLHVLVLCLLRICLRIRPLQRL